MPLLTVDQIYQTQSRRTASRDVRIAGISVDHVQTVDYGFGIAQVPTATIRVRGRAPAAAVFHATVTIDAGFNGINMRQFTGRIDHVDPDGPDTVLACMGETQALDVPYQKQVYTFTNVSSQQAITDMLNNAGVTAFQVNMPTPLWQIGTVIQPTLSFQTWGEAIQKVAEVEGAAWYEFPDGVTRVARVDPIPSVTASRQIFSKNLTGVTSTYPTGITQSITVGGVTYPTLPHIRQPRAEQQIREVKNEVFVRGATLNVTQGDGTVTPLPLELDDKASSPWVVKPDGSQAYNDYIFTSELLDTQAKCADVVARLLSLLNRLTYKATIVVDWDPSVIIGATYQVEDPQYSGMTGNWFVVGYQSSMAESDASTTITLIGGAQAGGQGNISPFAFFVYDIEREVIGTKVYAIVTLNGLLSKDLDGPSVTYSWSDNQGFVSGTTPILTVRIDPTLLTNPWIVTLTVTDNMGATGSLALTISIDSTANNVAVPAVFVAFDNYFSATPDGGQTWYDQASGGKNVISVGALSRGNALAGTAIYGTQQGDLYRTTDYCKTALALVLSGIGSPFVHVYADRNNIHHIYALTQDGRIYRSISDGASGTWTLYDDLRVVFGLPGMRANRIAFPINGIWVYGGEGNGRPLIAVDPVTNGHTWKKAALGGHLLADLTAVGFANTDLYIYDASSREQGELAIILNSATFQPAVYYTDDIHGDGSRWMRATGLPAKSRGRYIGPDLQQGQYLLSFDDTVMYRGDVTNSVMAVTAAPAALQATDAVNHGGFLGDWLGGVASSYLFCAEGTPDGTLWKTWDRAGTLQKFRPAVGFPAALAGMNAKQFSIGDPANVTLDYLLALQGGRPGTGPDTYARRIGRLDATWANVTNPAAASNYPFGWFYHFGAAYYRLDATSHPPDSHNKPAIGQMQRSTDLITWTNVGPAPSGTWGISNMDRGADGTLYAVAMDYANGTIAGKLYRSIDEGVNWVDISSGVAALGSGVCLIDVACHPTNKDYVVLIGDDFPGLLDIWRSTNATGAANFTLFSHPGGGLQSLVHTRQGIVLDSGRLVLVTQAGGSVAYTDTYSGSLIAATGIAGTTYSYELYYGGPGVIFFAAGSSNDSQVYRSKNGGATWEVVSAEFGTGHAFPQANNIISQFYDPVQDRLYLATPQNGNFTNSGMVMMIANAASGPSPAAISSIFDLTLNLAGLWTGNQDAISPQGITR